MTNTTSGRAACTILAVALLLSFAGPTRAADPQQPDPAFGPVPTTSAEAPQAQPASPAPAADQQLSESDRAAHQDDLKQPVIVTQQNEAQAQPAPTVRPSPVVAGSQNATWDETSLIGKIFIGFGALLTIASAARMFMA
jgi:hypothetical protein